MLESFYKPLQVYREVIHEDNFGNETADNNWQPLKTIYGFIQLTGAAYAQSNQRNYETSTHTLYTSLGSGIEAGDGVAFESKFFTVNSVQDDSGISGVSHHQEIELSYMNDVEVPTT